jgi:cytochrome c553
MLFRSLTSTACALITLTVTGANASPTRVDQQVRNALQLEHNVGRGEKLYRKHCAQCHGTEALGSAADVIPSLAGQRKAYLIKQLADFTELERQNLHMHRVVGRPGLSEPQVWADIAGYLSGLAPLKFPQTGDRSGVELGEAIFHEQCASCHEEDARGDDDGFVPSLRDQHYSYLVRQIRNIGAWHRTNVDADFARFMGSLDVDELTAVADYLSSMRGPTRDRARLNDDGTIIE